MGITELHDFIHRKRADELRAIKSEVYRYLGYRRIEKNSLVDSYVDKAIAMAYENMSPASICESFPVSFMDGKTDLGFAITGSTDIVKNLRNSSHCILLAATLGPRFDQLMLKAAKTDATLEAILQSVGAMFIESYLDDYNEELKKQALSEGYELRPRYSPGYGDLPLSLQADIFKTMRMDRIGLTLSDSLLMIPSKSVTAIIGLEKICIKQI